MSRKFDIMHLHVSTGASFWRKALALSMGKARRARVVVQVHSGAFDAFVTDGIKGRIARTLLKMADIVIVLSPEGKGKLKSSINAPIAVVPNGIRLRAPAGMRTSGPIVSIGRLCRGKGTFDLIQALEYMSTLDARLVLAGDGDVTEARQTAAAAGVADRVTFAGWLSPGQCAQLLDSASIFVLPSYSEGLPMALLEAMASAKPVVTTPVGGIPSLVREGYNGLLVEPGDVNTLATRLDWLLGDGELCTRLGTAARKTVQESFSMDATVAQLAEIYRSLSDKVPLG